jgi:hypothetical protein
MTLTVRLDQTLDAALTRYCAESGTSKSLVVQESLAVYLSHKTLTPGKPATAASPMPSANFKAFVDAGLVGALNGVGTGTKGADKAAVRARVAASFARRKVQPGTA